MSVTMNQRTFKIELFQGDDLDRLAELSNAASAVKPGPLSTGMEDGEYAAAAEAHDAFLANAKTRAETVEMKPMLRKPYQALQVANPPRDDNDSDAALGANSDTFVEELLLGCIVGPPDIAADKQAFLDSLNNAQFQLLADEAVTINRVVFAPKAPLLGSAGSPSSDETTVSPASSTG